MEPFINRDGSFSLSGFYPDAVKFFTVENQVWAIPAGVDPAGHLQRSSGHVDRVAFRAERWTTAAVALGRVGLQLGNGALAQ